MGRASPSDAELLEAWYSGNSGGEVVSYTEAAIWQVLTFTKPQGYCGGALGYWGEPPA
ncbi:MAG: sugar dehydrogenase complex small subunit [Pseudomonadota bacterium]